MDISVQSTQFSYFQEVKRDFSASIKGKENVSSDKSVTISREARFLATINSDSASIKIDFTMKASEEKTSKEKTDFSDWSSDDPVMKKLLMILEYLSDMTGKDLKSQFMKKFKDLSHSLKNEDNRELQMEKDITRARSLDMKVSFTFDLKSGNTRVEVEGAMADPLVLDLDSDGIETTDLKKGVNFDINGDGNKEKTAFTTGGDGLLALDRNNDGQITSGSELFGDQNGAEDGFMELKKFDSNGDSIINREDSVFKDLKVFISTENNTELHSLDEFGINEILINGKKNAGFYNNGNYIKETAAFKRTDGSEGNIGEVYFTYKTSA
jgi:hypothetical protein